MKLLPVAIIVIVVVVVANNLIVVFVKLLVIVVVVADVFAQQFRHCFVMSVVSSSTTNNQSICVIRNIPASLEAIDLRVFFAALIERDAFATFHYLKRAELVVNAANEVQQSATRCCLIAMRSSADASDLIRMYHGKLWRRRDGATVGDAICVVQRVSLDSIDSAGACLCSFRRRFRREF